MLETLMQRQAMAHGRRSWAWRVGVCRDNWRAQELCWQVLAFVALPELASAFIEVQQRYV